MTLLFVSFVMPYPANRGDKRRILSILQSLSAKHSVTLLCFHEHAPSDSAMEALRHYCDEVTVIPLTKQRMRWNQLTALVGGQPLRVSACRSATMAVAVAQAMASRSFDVLFACDVRMAPYVVPLRHDAKVLDFIDAYSIYYERAAQNESNWLKRLILQSERRRMRRYERQLTDRFTASMVCSHLDQKVLCADSVTPTVHMVPNTIDVDSYAATAEVEPNSIAFVGYMGHKANIDAAVRFRTQVFPRILEQMPGARFYIVGDGAGEVIARLAQGTDRVVVTGRVEALPAFLAACQVFVCPLDTGAGTRIKLLEAMAIGIPIVTTSLGCEGMDVTHGEHVLIANQDATFAQAVVTLLQDAALRMKLVTSAQTFVRKHHDVPVVTGHLDHIFETLCVSG